MWTPDVRRPSFAVTLLALLLPLSVSAQQYHRTDLTTNASTVSPAPNIDDKLTNAWGMSRGSGGPWWISDNGSGFTTVYNGAGVPFVPPGAPQPLVVKIATPDGTGTATPTGTVFNATPDFLVGPGAKAIFLFVTEDGTISGWNPGVDPANTVIVKNRAGSAVYKGCAIAVTPQGSRFYATNFQSGQVEIYNGSFARINPNNTTAFRIPGISSNYAPFNIQNVGGNLVVTFARRAPGSLDEDHGAGVGYVAVFDAAGNLLKALQHGPWLNAPWGVALAPGDFGKFSHRLLIGNFGDGTIHAFNLFTGKHEGAMLDDTTGMTLTIDGLWGLSFGGDSVNNGMATTLFFTAGPNDEADGIYGSLTALAAEQPGNSQ
jgi:uncharacterized protein (TIGR03118 family)